VISRGTFECVREQNASASPFGATIVISIGFLVVLLCVLPLSVLNIEDNIWVQILCTFLFLLVLGVWCVDMVLIGPSVLHDSHLPLITKEQSGITGVILLNYAFVTTVPSWICEKEKHVSVHWSIWPGMGAPFIIIIIIFILFYCH
jgi:hypothetical protein